MRPSRSGGTSLLAIAVLVAGCTTPASPSPTLQAVAPVATPTASPGPGSTAAPTPQATPNAAAIQDVGVDVDGDVRTVEMVTPSFADAGEALPLLVLLHGNGEGPTRWVTKGSPARADLLAEQERIVIALPTGRGGRWDAYLDAQPESADVAYVAGLVEWILATYNVDPRRVYVGGFSMGAVLAGRLACEDADTFAGFLMDAGGDWGGKCTPTAPVTVVAMHGTNDTTLPFQPALAFTASWRSHDGCTADPATTTLTAGAVATTSVDCEHGSAVMFVRMQGANHRYFDDPDALRLAWAFFTSHQRR